MGIAQQVGQGRPINPILTPDFAALLNDPANFKSLAICPPQQLGIAEDTFTIMKAADEAFFGDANTSLVRAVGQPYARSAGVAVDSFEVVADEFGKADFLDDKKRRTAQYSAWSATLAANGAHLALAREKRFFDTMANPANWTDSFTAAHAWNTASADIYADIDEQMSAVKLCGKRANVYVLTETAFKAAKRNKALLDALPMTKNRGIASESTLQEAIADAWGLPVVRNERGDFVSAPVYVIDTVFNTANAGNTASMGFLSGAWGWAGYIDPKAAQQSVDGKTVDCFTTALLRAVVEEPSVSTWRTNDPPGEHCAEWFTEAITKVFSRCGCLVSGVV